MAQINFSPWVENVRGAFGRLVFKQLYGRMFVMRKPQAATLPPTAAQLRQREVFAEAARYAKSVFQEAALRQPYVDAARERNTNPAGLAMADFLSLPKVTKVDLTDYHGQVGDPIRVHASDDFGLVSAGVRIRDKAGVTLEQGLAANVAGVWTYHATTAAPADQTLTITATAKDRAHEQARDETWHA